jgi:hypothetical protein
VAVVTSANDRSGRETRNEMLKEEMSRFQTQVVSTSVPQNTSLPQPTLPNKRCYYSYNLVLHKFFVKCFFPVGPYFYARVIQINIYRHNLMSRRFSCFLILPLCCVECRGCRRLKGLSV